MDKACALLVPPEVTWAYLVRVQLPAIQAVVTRPDMEASMCLWPQRPRGRPSEGLSRHPCAPWQFRRCPDPGQMEVTVLTLAESACLNLRFRSCMLGDLGLGMREALRFSGMLPGCCFGLTALHRTWKAL